MPKVKLPADVAEQYELVNWKGGPRQNFGRFGDIDLEKLTLARARKLVSLGFTKLREKPAPKTKAKDETN